jgi:hypothetical protein
LFAAAAIGAGSLNSPPADSPKMQTLKNALWFAPLYLAGLYLTIVSIDCFIKVERAIQSAKAYQHSALIQAGGR